jgi:DNA-directed RNA polymerase II subunit RPB2
MVYRQQDMPFSKEGIVPDIIINPHAIPSRMTIGQMMECIMGKACCQLGTMGDATPFNGATVEDLAEVLESYGMERYGNEVLYDGRTGVQITTEIFIGPTFYQRLKHMVEDKMHTRGGNGPVVMLTRQPAEGRARNGGLRFGEMERDAIVAHGASAFLKERMLDVSDNYRVFVCRKCGMLCVANPEKNIYKCTHCKNSADITQARIPYSMKLLLQELMTMAIAPRIVI